MTLVVVVESSHAILTISRSPATAAGVDTAHDDCSVFDPETVQSAASITGGVAIAYHSIVAFGFAVVAVTSLTPGDFRYGHATGGFGASVGDPFTVQCLALPL